MAKSRKESKSTPPIETSNSLQSHPTKSELYALGKSLRDKCPRQDHAIWRPADDRPDPVKLMLRSNEGRIPELVPIRHGRMLQSPFSFRICQGAKSPPVIHRINMSAVAETSAIPICLLPMAKPYLER